MQHIYTVLIRLPADVEVLMNPGRWKYNKVVNFHPVEDPGFIQWGLYSLKVYNA